MTTQLKSNPTAAAKSSRPKLKRTRRAALCLMAVVICGGAGIGCVHSF